MTFSDIESWQISINILDEDQTDVAEIFAVPSRRSEGFKKPQWSQSNGDSAIIEGGVAANEIEYRLHDLHEALSHTTIV